MNKNPNAIVQQPSGSANAEFERQATRINCGQEVGLEEIPNGLQGLLNLETIQVIQGKELLEAVTGFETNNKYKILNDQNQLIFSAKEDTDCCTRNCCGKLRPFHMVLNDPEGREVINFERPLACSACCFPCCLQSLQVFSPPGNLIGSIEQSWSIFFPQYNIKDSEENTVYKIKGPLCPSSCCGDVKFHILSVLDGTKVGEIYKQWSGFLQEALTDADNFGIEFPDGVDTKVKATLLGACILIDFMYFENSQK